MLKNRDALKRCLDRLYRTFDRSYLSSDPLFYVHQFKRARDREVVGLIASGLAYGKVAGIKRSIEKVLSVMGSDPYGFVAGFRPERDKARFSSFAHRFTKGEDISCLIYFARQMIEEEGSIGDFFLRGYSPEHKNVKEALTSFSENALRLDSAPVYGRERLPRGAGVRFFFPSPSGGSPCKRLNLYLRWMVRKDGLDLGVWKGIDPSRLVMPLDTHVARISRNLGLTERTSPGWKMAEEITEGLKELDPRDPVKYDFSISRLGILEMCTKRIDRGKCRECLIKGICVL